MSMRMKKNCLRFTSTEEDTLIDLVQKYPALHCMANRTYKKLEAKENIWKMVAQEVGRSVKDCKVRWKSIRDYFQKKKKSATGGLLGGDAYYDEKFQRLHFLEEFYPSGKAIRNAPSLDSPELTPHDMIIEEIYDDINTDSDDKNDDSELNDDDNVKKKRTEARNTDAEKRRIRSKRRKTDLKRDTGDVPRMRERKGLRDLRNDSDSKPVKNRNEEETDLFFKAMCATAKNLPPHYLLESKKKIFNILFDLEMRAAYERDLPNTSYVQNPTRTPPSPSSSISSVEQSISNESDAHEDV